MINYSLQYKSNIELTAPGTTSSERYPTPAERLERLRARPPALDEQVWSGAESARHRCTLWTVSEYPFTCVAATLGIRISE